MSPRTHPLIKSAGVFDMFDPTVPAVDAGDIIGYTASGAEIRAIAGAARATMEAWVPVEYDSTVIQRIMQMSAIERYARRVPMKTQTKSTPRSGGVGISLVAKGGTYPEDVTANDEVILRAQKFGTAVRIAEEDVDDTIADVVNAKSVDWATAYAKALDNAALGVTVARATSGAAFDSLYWILTQADAVTGYTANANRIQTAAGALSYANLSAILGKVEQGDYFDEANTVVIAHPSFKARLREVLDTQNRPIFQESSNGTAGGGQAPSPDRVFGYPIAWSLGARTSATVTSAPTGNPLFAVVNSQFLMMGVRSGPEYVFIDGRNGLAALTDESILKMRSRRAFALGHQGAAAILEAMPAV